MIYGNYSPASTHQWSALADPSSQDDRLRNPSGIRRVLYYLNKWYYLNVLSSVENNLTLLILFNPRTLFHGSIPTWYLPKCLHQAGRPPNQWSSNQFTTDTWGLMWLQPPPLLSHVYNMWVLWYWFIHDRGEQLHSDSCTYHAGAQQQPSSLSPVDSPLP